MGSVDDLVLKIIASYGYGVGRKVENSLEGIRLTLAK
jgi:hypothetical protein